MLHTKHCISLLMTLCAGISTAAQSVELDANGDAKPGSSVPYRYDFQNKLNKLRKQTTDSVNINELIHTVDTKTKVSKIKPGASTENTDECDMTELTYTLDWLRVRYINNMLYRTFDMALYRDGLNEFPKISTQQLRDEYGPAYELLADYKVANNELLTFIQEIQSKPERTDNAGAKIWAINSLRGLKALPAYNRLRRGTFANMYLINLTSKLEQRLIQSRDHNEMVNLEDLIKILTRSSEKQQIFDHNNNFTSQLDTSQPTISNSIGTIDSRKITHTDKQTDNEVKSKERTDTIPVRRKMPPRRPDSIQDMSECEVKRMAINEDIDRMRIKYGRLILTMPYDEYLINSAQTELAQITNPSYVKQAETVTNNLRFYEAANSAVKAAVTAAQQSARESDDFDRQWYDHARQRFNDTPAVRSITDGTHQVSFLSMIINEFNALLDRGIQQQAPAKYIPFERLLNEMIPIE